MSSVNWEREDFDEEFWTILSDESEELDEFEDEPVQTAEDAAGNCLKIWKGILVNCTGPGGEVIIPEGVTEIDRLACQVFNGCTGVNIPESVTKISHYAFECYYCRELAEIRVAPGNQDYCSINGLLLSRDGTVLYRCPSGKKGALVIPESVTRIEDKAFEGCHSLTYITIPEGITEISNWAFRGCTSLTGVAIPESVVKIGRGFLDGCSALTSLVIPKSVVEIDENAFWSCTSLTEIKVDAGNPSYCIIDGLLMSRDGSVLYKCSPAKTGVVMIPEGITRIGNGAFEGCSGLTGVEIPESVTEIGGDAFGGCSSLTNVTIPKGVTDIYDYTFYGCTSLTSVAIPEGVIGIGEYAFGKCTNLTSVNIPESVTYIDCNAFEDCTKLTGGSSL